MTQQTNIFNLDPETTDLQSTVISVRPHSAGMAVALQQNPFRAAGGGEPRDIGTVEGFLVRDVTKQNGMTWLALGPEAAAVVRVGAVVHAVVDAGHRQQRRKLHTAVHMLIRCACNHFGHFAVTEAEIAEDASHAWVTASVNRAFDQGDVSVIDRNMRSLVHQARHVNIAKAKSLEAAEETYGALFRVSDRHAFKGRVRLACIDGFDVNPCGGLHHENSGIGPYVLEPRAEHDMAGSFSVIICLTKTWMYWFS